MNDKYSRRAIVLQLGLAAGLAGTLKAGRAAAAPAARLDEKDPAAVKFGYVEEANHVDVKKYPKFVAGSNCENCLLLAGKPGEAYRPCNLFPDKLVKASGWCTAWTAEM